MTLRGTSTPPFTRASADERAILRCEKAREYEESGDYERARRELGDLWQGVGQRPKVSSFGDEARAVILLRVGVLSGWLGSAKQIEGAQEKAKDLISESLRLFEYLKDDERAAEAQTELGFCYWRAGEHDEARVHFRHALTKLKQHDSIQKAITSLRIAAVEMRATRYATALSILIEIAPVVERRGDHALKGRFYNSLGIVRESLSAGEAREEGLDAAMMDYEAALYHFEQARNTRFQAYTLNNLGYINFVVGKFDEAHSYLYRARKLFNSFGDTGSIAQVDETRARAFLAQGRYAEAEKFARLAVRVQERGEQRGLLAEAMVTRAMALVRLGKSDKAIFEFQEAGRIALEAGDREGAGRASLALIESLYDSMTAKELNKGYLHAEELLRDTQHPETISRLRAAARKIIAKNNRAGERAETAIIRTDKPINLKQEVLAYEGRLIKHAFALTGNRLRQAAKLLGFRHHQTLSLTLKERHRDLLTEEEKPTPPKRNIVRH